MLSLNSGDLTGNVPTPLSAGENVRGGDVEAPARRRPARGYPLQRRVLRAAAILGERAARAERAARRRCWCRGSLARSGADAFTQGTAEPVRVRRRRDQQLRIRV